MVLVKNCQFLYLFLVKKLGQENIFHDILERKKYLSSLGKQEVQKVEK